MRRSFLLILLLFVGHIYCGKRGPKVYPKKDETSDEYKRASSFFKAQCDASQADVETSPATGADSANLPNDQEVEEAPVGNQRDAMEIESVDQVDPESTQPNDQINGEICPAPTVDFLDTLSSPVGKRQNKKSTWKKAKPFTKKDVKKWTQRYPFMQFDIESQSFQCGVSRHLAIIFEFF